MTTSTLIAAKDVTKLYQMGDVQVAALRGVDFTLFEGEFVVLLGHSGSGKSTLLNILGGLDRPTAGELIFEGQRIDSYTDRELTQFRRANIGFVFQNYNLIPRLNARENIELVTEIATKPMPAEKALDLVGLSERATHFPAQLSGGEQQRIAIARAIAKQPKLLFCDEPTGALDVRTGIVVLEAIENVNRNVGTTTVVITHNAVIADLADRVVILKDGRINEVRSNQIKKNAKDLKW